VDGIYAASRALRHGDIAITSQHYLDKKSRGGSRVSTVRSRACDNLTLSRAIARQERAKKK